VLPHSSHKNKDVAKMGHPNIVGIYLPKQQSISPDGIEEN
jgi:hypothetical protein